ncbi:MAG TPA: TonB family protein [Bryobacteraceae bacterium]|jgi:TonB family protein
MLESALFSTAVALALKTTAILAAARIATWLLRRNSASARHQVWTAACAAALLLPLLSVSLPAWRPAATAAIAPVFFEVTTTASATVATQPAASAASSTPASSRTPWRPDLRGSILSLWIVGCFLTTLPLARAALRLRRQRRDAGPSPYSGLAADLAAELELHRPIDILETPAGTMPMTQGTLRPAVFLPADARHWTEDRRRMVLLHELAHVRRADAATQLLTRAMLTLNWWNPLAWTAWRETLKERERAADDLVLHTGARASEYAENLLEIARHFQKAPLASAAVCMARPAQLEGRLLAILDATTNRSTGNRTFAAANVLVAIALVAPLAALHAQQAAPKPNPDVDATIRAAQAQQNPDIADQPAQAFADKRDFDTARALLDTAAGIRAGVSGTGSVNYGLGLIKIADLEARRHNTSEAVAFYSKAVQVLGDRPEAAPAFIYLGVRSLTTKSYDQAATYFQTAQALKSPQAGTAAMWMGVLKERQNDPSGAESMYQAALGLQGSDSPEAATTMQLYSLFLTRRGRTAEAQTMSDRAGAQIKSKPGQPVFRGTAPPPAQSPTTAAAVRPGNGVGQPRLVFKQEPTYSDEARIAKLQGSVRLSLVVAADGTPTNIQVVGPLGLGLDQAAVDAVSSWVFKPGTKDGLPVPVMASVEVNFRLL